MTRSDQPRFVLGIGGGIAAYKACELLRRFSESGADVTAVPTAAALQFVGAPTWAALSGKAVSAEVWDDVHRVPHVKIGQQADLLVVAPATADLLAKAAHGLADDLLSNTLLTARCPVVMAPAMHTEMWEHPATVANVATLRQRGVHVLDPAHGRLTGADTGPGRLPEPRDIFEFCQNILLRPTPDLVGRRVLISAGGTREFLDPVRYLGNSSSGLQGFALAAAARARGAEVTLIAANSALPVPHGVTPYAVQTTAALEEAVRREAVHADVVIMAAAPADFTPARPASQKIKKQGTQDAPVLELVQTPDILAGLVSEPVRPGQVVVGFAAETGDEQGTVLEHARAKFQRKGCDLLVVNDVSGGAVFGQTENQVHLLSRDGVEREVPRGSKQLVAHAILDAVLALPDRAL